MTRINIGVSFDRSPYENPFGMGECVIMRWEIVVHVRMVMWINGIKAKELHIQMEALDSGYNEDELRRTLLKNQRADGKFYVCQEPHSTDIIIEIIDPDGILKWLGLDATAVETFKQTKEHAKPQPLRLSAEDPR